MAWLSYAVKNTRYHGGNALYYEPFDNYVHLNTSSTGAASLNGHEFDQRFNRPCVFMTRGARLQRMIQLTVAEFQNVMERQKANTPSGGNGCGSNRKKRCFYGSCSDNPSGGDMKTGHDTIEAAVGDAGNEPEYDFTVDKPPWTVPYTSYHKSSGKKSPAEEEAEEEAIFRHLCCS
jgi:hypothetical protein